MPPHVGKRKLREVRWLGPISNIMFSAQLVATEVAKSSPPMKKKRSCCRGVVKLKIVAPALGGKHFVLCFPPSMGARILSLTTPLQRNGLFKSGLKTLEGLQKLGFCFPPSMGSNIYFASHRAWEQRFSLLHPLSDVNAWC